MSTTRKPRILIQEFRPRYRSRAAFTLVEILVALAVMMLLLTIILVPVNMALDVFHIGKARNEVQQANRLVINQIAADLRQAVYVYPNEQMPGITNKAPYSTDPTVPQAPYYSAADTNTRYSNTSRIDMLLPAQGVNGAASTPLQASNYIVTYYARRFDVTKPFDAYSNPVVLFRAQYPYKNDASSSTNTTNLVNNTASRYSTVQSWLTQTSGEPNLQSQSDISNNAVVAANHLQISPRDMAMVAPSATDATPDYQPDSSFVCDDTNSDGKIDRVTVSIHLAKYDSIGAQSKNQRLRSTQLVDLPNIK